jgi:hypothetical protein
MNSKTTYVLTIATIAIATATLAISPMVTQVFASFSGSNGEGHETTQTCTNNGGKVKEGPCGGNSAQSDNNADTTTTTRGKSNNIADQETR